ncbi:UNVERIFIED_CONTAM: hypothetical protein Sangu_0486700 [Sesamum angustifolium]|uniref:DUF8040 domain-containing protein n=1 Tax=Sesamum angustifolium TaxID=2727405 RepID=A0AAW2Q872_9LAMI
MRRLVEFSDIACIENLRMSRNAFGKLCLILQNQGGLQDSKHVPLSSQVAMFLSILAHHKKNRTVKYDFIRSGRTVSKHFHRVLNAVLRLHPLLLANPTPVPPNNNYPRWKWFEGCLGALDGTYIDVRVKAEDRARYPKVVPLIVEFFEMQLPVPQALKYLELLMDDDASKGVRRRGGKRDGNYHAVWSTAEEEALLECLRKFHTAETERSENVPVTPEYYVPTPDPTLYGDDDEFMNSFASAAQPTVNRADTERVSSRKRKMVATDIDDKFDEKFEAFVNVTDRRLGDIAKRFGMEAEESQARKQV